MTTIKLNVEDLDETIKAAEAAKEYLNGYLTRLEVVITTTRELREYVQGQKNNGR